MKKRTTSRVVYTAILGLILILALNPSGSSAASQDFELPQQQRPPGQDSELPQQQEPSKPGEVSSLSAAAEAYSSAASTIDVPLDIVLVQDETGSMGPHISTLKSLAPEIWDGVAAMSTAGFRMGVVGFQDFARSPWGSSGNWVYRLTQDLTLSRSSFVAGVNTLIASGGGDWPECQYAAIYYAVTPSHPCIDSSGNGHCLDSFDTPSGQQPSFRSGAMRIILLATDASFHDPETTPGYPGPSRDTVVNALQASNTVVVGLVPGGAGSIPQVDDLASKTGGSVQDTGSSGAQVAQAIADALKEYRSRPGSEGSLTLITDGTYKYSQAIVPILRVDNPTDRTSTYTVTVLLRQDGTTLAAQSRENIGVPVGTSVLLDDIDFGTRPPDAYQLVAELWGESLLQTRGPVDIWIASEGQETGIFEGGKLKEAADAEFEQMTDIVVNRAGDGLDQVTSLLIDIIFEKLDLVESFKHIGETTGLPVGKAVRAVGGISKFTSRIAATSGLSGARGAVESEVREFLTHGIAEIDEEYAILTYSENVANRQSEFNRSVVNADPFIWNSGMGGIVSRGVEAISSRVEEESIPGLIGPNPPYLGVTTLHAMDSQWSFVAQVLKWLGIIGFVVALILLVVVLIKITIVSFGATVPAIVISVGTLASTFLFKMGPLTWLKIAARAGLVVFAVYMLFAAHYVADAVDEAHKAALQDLLLGIDAANGSSFRVSIADVSVRGTKASITSDVTNDAPGTAGPLVETTVYAVDGGVVAHLVDQPSIETGNRATLSKELDLRSGRYRAVTAVHTREGIGLATAEAMLEVKAASVDVSVQLEETQLALGDRLEATIVVTNNDPVSSTGPLGLFAHSTDQQNAKGWEVRLASGENRRVDYSFVPQSEGSERLRIGLTDGLTPLVVRDIAYVVGDGPSVAVNYDILPAYTPGAPVLVSFSAVNSGNQPTTTVLSLQTVNLNAGPSAIVAENRSFHLSAGESEEWTATTLSGAQAVPGHFAITLHLDGVPYRSSEFFVEAEDTLFPEIYPDGSFHDVGDAVSLRVNVMNAEYTHTDADVDVSLWRPDGVAEAVVMNRLATGQYEGLVTALISGTYSADVEVSKPDYRGIKNYTFFVANERSQLLSIVDGRPILGNTRPVTFTVRNEHGAPILGARVVVSGTQEYLSRNTNEIGQTVLRLSPATAEAYQVSLEKPGFARTLTDLPVWIAPDVVPPLLTVIVPAVTNHTPVEVMGWTDAAAAASVNDQPVVVDSEGWFTTTVPLGEGTNVLTATATDSVGNTTTVTREVQLDTEAPMLVVTEPPEGLETTDEVIRVAGTTSVDATVVVSGTLASTGTPGNSTASEPELSDESLTASESDVGFSAWISLHPGVNEIPIVATDAAGNTTSVIWTVTLQQQDSAQPVGGKTYPSASVGQSVTWIALAVVACFVLAAGVLTTRTQRD